jgi:hypothetical protein
LKLPKELVSLMMEKKELTKLAWKELNSENMLEAIELPEMPMETRNTQSSTNKILRPFLSDLKY